MQIHQYLDNLELISASQLKAVGNNSPIIPGYRKFWIDKSCEGQIMVFAETVHNQIKAIDSHILQPYFSSNSIVEAFETMPAIHALDKFFREAQVGAPRVFNPITINHMLFSQGRRANYTDEQCGSCVDVVAVITHNLTYNTQRIRVSLKDNKCSAKSEILNYEIVCAEIDRGLSKGTRIYWCPEIGSELYTTSLNSINYLQMFTEAVMKKRFDLIYQ